MMTFDDEPTIRNAIMKRLGAEPGVRIADILTLDMTKEKSSLELPAGWEGLKPSADPHIQVGIWWIILDRVNMEGLIDGRSFFDLPPIFEHSHLVNEIDEICEQVKIVRKETGGGAILYRPGAQRDRKAVLGTGFRGRWPEKTKEPERAR